jgi:hypothetical protein
MMKMLPIIRNVDIKWRFVRTPCRLLSNETKQHTTMAPDGSCEYASDRTCHLVRSPNLTWLTSDSRRHHF